MRGFIVLPLLVLFTMQNSFGECVPGKIESFNTKFKSFKTGYFPEDSEMEGGFKDRVGNPLRTLQNYVRGKDKYVSVAMDHEDDRFPYGTLLRIPEIEAFYGKCIVFKVVDTGGRFVGRGEKKIDICNETEQDTYSRLTNGWSEIYVVDEANFRKSPEKKPTEAKPEKKEPSDNTPTPTPAPEAPKPPESPAPPAPKKPNEPIPPWVFN